MAASKFPESWGAKPGVQTMDYRPLPGGYGHGSSTLAKWIESNMARDREAGSVQWPPAWGQPPRRQTRDLRTLPFGYGRGSGTLAKWIAQNAEEVYRERVEEFEGYGKPVEAASAELR